MSVCFPSGIEMVLKKDKSGRFDYNSFRHPSEAYIAILYQETLNASVIYVTKGVNECIQLLKEAQVDVIVANTPIENATEYYHVPFATEMSYLNILTGYDHDEYNRGIQSDSLDHLGILSNYRGFQWKVYFCLAILIVAFLVLALCYTVVDREKNLITRKTRPISNYKKKFFRIIRRSYQTNSREKAFTFLVMLATFFILTPFFLLFHTNQIIVSPPQMLRDFDDAIHSRAKILYTPTCGNPENFIDPHKNKQVMDYFLKNREIIILPTVETADPFHEKIVEIIKRSAIFIVPQVQTQILYRLMCSWSKDNEMFKLMVYRMRESTEFLTGIIFNRNYTDPKGLKNFASIIETGLLSIQNGRFYIGFGFYSHSLEHIKEQMILCDNFNHLEKKESEVYHGNFQSFNKFFCLCSLLFLLAWVLLLVELLVLKRSTKVSKSRYNSNRRIYNFKIQTR